MNLIVGIVGSIIAAAAVALLVKGYKMWFGQQIKITHPQPTETLTNPEPLGQSRAWPIKGEPAPARDQEFLPLARAPESHSA